MAEYIEREAMIDEIEGATWYHISCQKNLVEGAACEADALYKATDIYNIIKSAPTADVVEVVRCGDLKMDCNKTINFYHELKRLCGSRTACDADANSKEQCPLFAFCRRTLATQSAEEFIKAMQNLQKWSNEHAKKTYKQDFLEKFPEAQRNRDGVPLVCKKRIYDGMHPTFEDCDYTGTCKNCWNEPMEE